MTEQTVAHIDESVLRDAPAHDYILEIEETPRARAARELREANEDDRITPVKLLGLVVFTLAFFWFPVWAAFAAWVAQ